MDKYENRAMELESGIAAFETKNLLIQLNFYLLLT